MVGKNLSVIMSVYANDSPLFLQQAIDSVFQQTVLASEFIIVIDGPIGDALNEILAATHVNPTVKVIRLDQNMGAGAARKIAIDECSTEFVALMDADDICVSDRFEAQLREFSDENIGVVGGQIEEFRENPEDLGVVRVNPIGQKAIYSYGKWRNPINHVTLMYRMSCYKTVGGYSNVRHIEDWELISRFLVNNVRIVNLPKTLVHVRSGDAMVVRRRKWAKFIGRMGVFWIMYKNSYFGLHNLFGNVFIHAVLRFMPASFTSFIYQKFLRKRHST